MPDGVVLVADRYFAPANSGAPIVLIRTPYNRRAFGVFARIFAERGYQAIVQSARGTFGSGGTFNAFRDEERDGRATLEWLSRQPWFNGKIGMFGLSYLGLTQWAVAADAPEYVKALAIQISASSFRDLFYPGEAFGLHGALTWVSLVQEQERPLWQILLALPLIQRRLARGLRHLPLREADRVATGRSVRYFQDWLVHTSAVDPFWSQIDYSLGFDRVSAPVNLIAGWHDIFLGRQLADYVGLRRGGKPARLTVGPWVHRSLGAAGSGLRESLSWFDTYLLGKPAQVGDNPVRIFVMGAKRWLDLPDWPPPATPLDWFLDERGRLGAAAPPASEGVDEYVYDPALPTPAVGGPLLSTGTAVFDNRKLEARSDVLTYTSAPLDADLTVVGGVDAELFVHSSVPHADFFARLCDVEPSGRSLNVCDGVVRIANGSWPACVRIELSSTAYLFRMGHRLRLQVSSGAFPRFNRNLGRGEPLGEGVSGVRARQQVLHGPAHRSRLRVAVFGTRGTDDLL
jgi:uncharacterized protein